MISRRVFGIGVLAMAGDGLVKPLNAPPGVQAAPGVQPGVSQAVVFARQVIIAGAKGGLFVYDSTGTLIASIAGAAGTGPLGGSFGPGIESQAGGGTFTVTLFGGEVIFGSGALIFSNSAGAITLETNNGASIFLAGGPVEATDGSISTPTVITTDTWQAAILGNSWTGTAQYMLNPDNTVSLRTSGSLGAGTLANGTVLFTLPAAYRPATAQQIPCIISAVGAGSTPSGASPFLTVGTNGQVAVTNIAVPVASNIRFEGTFSLT